MKSFSVLLLTLASTAVAVPANKYLPVITPTPVVARHVPAVAVIHPSPPPPPPLPHPLHLPGFNRLSHNNDDDNNNNNSSTNTDNNKSAPAAPANDDGTTCEQITLGGNGKVGKTTLEGKCTNNKGEWWKTSINLNECITNVGGKLQYLPDGGFDASCRPCTIDTVPGGAEINLKCNCLDWKRIPKFTYLEMGDRVDTSGAVKLVDGRFVCGDRTGDKSPLL
ncbi:SSCRP protein [Trichoderma parareesei]|uniref:SSCRP protein n=1 Tax=Trichoderma parareesei TaxID=858221 RepID=A0A2H2ZJ21_TRIPA|nr:SSCRP protein [Trichoderma parareesei]